MHLENGKNRLGVPSRRLPWLLFVLMPCLACSQPHSLELPNSYYNALGTLDQSPSVERGYMDTMSFPWNEYSQNALTYSLVRTVYLDVQEEARLPSLVTPPANSSAQTQQELQYLLGLQESRKPEEIQRAQQIASIGSWFNIINPTDSEFLENKSQLFYIASHIGSWYNPQQFPLTTELLLKCIQDIRVTEFRLKRHFMRPRPYHLEPRIHHLVRVRSPSFPSGHTLWAFAQAYLFSEIIPERRSEFLRKADEVRWSRELLGIHYPSDNEASRIIAWHLLKAWYKNPLFISDLHKAKEEWRQKRTLSATKKS